MYPLENTDFKKIKKKLVKLGVLNSYEEPWMILGTSQMNSDLRILTSRRRPPGEDSMGRWVYS